MTRRHPGLGRLVIGATCVVALLAAYVVTGQLGQGETVANSAGPITLIVDNDGDRAAGTATSVFVAASAPEGTLVHLAVFAPLNTTALDAPLTGGSATFAIDGELMRHAGLYRFVAQVGRSTSATVQIEVTPLDAVDPVIPLVGPRTIIADAADTSMTVVMPADRFGNPVVDGTTVDIEVVRPDGQRSLLSERVERALAAIVIESSTETGRVTISASVGAGENGVADGPSNVVDQVAGIPASFTLEVDARDPLADGFALHAVETSQLRDQFDNVLPDGVSAVFIVQDSSGVSFLQATVQGGIARTMLEAPNMPGTTTVTARVGGVESVPSVIDFTAAVTTFRATQQRDGDLVTILVGPVVTERGGYVPDGTPVAILDRRTGTVVATSALRGGVAEITIDDAPISLDAEVLGASLPIEEP